MKLIILDRDGVINEELYDDERVTCVEKFLPIEDSLAAIAKLKRAGYVVTVATNQSIISKGVASKDNLNEIHDHLQRLLIQKYQVQIDNILYCPHQSSDQCNCRKPKIGMLLEIAKKYKIEFRKMKIPFIGDSVIDVLAALEVGAVPVLVKTGKGLKSMLDPKIKEILNLLIFDNLSAFVEYWLGTGSFF